MAKGSAHAFALNQAVLSSLNAMSRPVVRQLKIAYIETKQNAISRGKRIDLQLTSALGPVEWRLASSALRVVLPVACSLRI